MMITLRWTTVALGALLASACTSKTDVLESTTTPLRLNEDVVATSADGLLAVRARIAGPLEGADLTIATRRDVQASGQRGLAYEIAVSRAVMLAASAEVQIEVPAEHDALLSVFARIEPDGSVVELEAERAGRRLTVRLAQLGRLLFTLVTTQCGLSDCGTPCGPSTTTSTTSCPFPAPAFSCSDTGTCLPTEQVSCSLTVANSGWDDLPGTGPAFIVNQLAIAGSDVVSDAVDVCNQTSPQNQLWFLGALLNDQLRQNILGGESLLLLELAGLDEPFTGSDRFLTLKVYGARDADDPFFPGNNFQVPPGHTTCCEFKLDPASLTEVPPQARSRTIARVASHELRTFVSIAFQFGLPFMELRLDRFLVSGTTDSALAELELTASAAWSSAALASQESPYCRTGSPNCPIQLTDASMLELILALDGAQPQVDLDFDGLETFHDDDGDGRIDRCVDGCIGSCTAPTVVMSTVDTSCALDPRFVDGYSITFELTAVRASLVGIGR